MLEHAPPDEERCFNRRQQSGEVPTLLWQINRLLDDNQDSDHLIDQLRESLYRALAEKARMTVELQRAEEVIDQSRRHSGYARIGQALPALQDKSRQRIPGWVLGRALMSTVPLGPEGLWQTFRAD